MAHRRVVVGPTGLHLRLAMRVASIARRSDATLRVGAVGRQALAASPWELLQLGVRPGEEVVLAAEGPGCDEAVAQLARLLAMGEGSYPGADARRDTAGVQPWSPGVGEGVLRRGGGGGRPSQERAGAVGERLAVARGRLEACLTRLVTNEARELVYDHLELLAEAAERLPADAELATLPTEVRDVLQALRAPQGRDLAERVVLVGRWLSAGDLLAWPAGCLAAAVSVGGGAGSHAAVVARGLRLPMVGGEGCRWATHLAEDTWLMVDGRLGGLRVREERRAP